MTPVKCLKCGKIVKGKDGIADHYRATGHRKFAPLSIEDEGYDDH